MKLITFISAGAFIFLSAFVMKKNDTPSAPLYESKWLLKKIYTESGVKEVSTKAFIKFDKAKKSAGGNGSCNGFGSSTTINGNIIIFKNIFSTKMYCEDVQKTENAFFKQLEKVNRFEVKGKILLLLDHNNLLLELTAE